MVKIRNITPFGFRAWPGVKEQLKKAASDNRRSMNHQINEYVVRGLRMDGYEVPRDVEPVAITRN